MTIFGEQVRQRRLAFFWSQSELARRAGITPSGLLRIESGQREPSLAVAVAIAGALGADLGELAGCRTAASAKSSSAESKKEHKRRKK